MPARMRRRPALRAAALLACVMFVACDDGPSEPERGYTIRIRSGDDQFAGFGQLLENPLQVTVEDASTGSTAQGVQVRWRIVEGSGADLGTEVSVTDANGVASTTLRLGPVDASYRVRASVTDLVGSAATFEATAVAPARIDSIAPAAADAGDTVVVYGTGFAPNLFDNTVLVAGFRARVLAATATSLRVVVPACVPSRIAAVQVDRGIVESNVVTLEVNGSGAAPLAMDVGEVVHLAGPDALDCVRLAGGLDTRYLLVLQNATDVPGRELPWRLTGAAPGLVAAPDRLLEREYASRSQRERTDPQHALDLELRELEGTAAAESGPSSSVAHSRAAPADPVVGDQRDFWVFRRAGEYERVTAVVRHVSAHAVLYEDVDAPDGGFQPGDFEAFGAVFDDPIYPTLVGVYGTPSDVDENDRIIILFTPVVNQLTAPGSGTGFVAGFFFGIDLLADQSRGNEAEIFYTLVPDPEGVFGNVRTFDQLLQGVPPVMAHEFQHMIHFNQRVLRLDAGLDQTWLSEALAHTAEEVVGDEYLERGDIERAGAFRNQNFLRALIWMNETEGSSLIGPAVPLAVRGGGWLLLEYLQGHFGGEALLTQLTQTRVSGAANLSAETGLEWGAMLSRFGVAVWADDSGVPGLDPAYTFPTVDLRAVYAEIGFPLEPRPLEWTDFGRTGALPSAASMYWMLEAGPLTGTLNVAVAGRHAPFGAADRPQLSILRVQ